MKPSSFLLSLLALLLLFSSAFSFQSDEILHNDDEFEGIRSSPDPAYVSPPVRRRPDLDVFSVSDSKSVEFSLEHSLGGSDFSVAGDFTARLKSWTHGGQVFSFSSCKFYLIRYNHILSCSKLSNISLRCIIRVAVTSK
jgi:ER membrane protein complex subunit 10